MPLNHNLITEEEFNNIKAMLSTSPVSQVKQVSGRGATTILNIEKADDWEAYKAYKASRIGEKKTPKARGKGYKMMKESDFKTLKAMLDFGISPKVIQTATGRSNRTLSFIKRAETFADYKQIQIEAHKPKVEPKVVQIEVTEEVVVPTQNTEILTDVVLALNNVSSALESLKISNDKLEERVVSTEDYIKMFAEAAAERRGLLRR